MVNVAELHGGAPIIVFLHGGPYSIGRRSYALLLTFSSHMALAITTALTIRNWIAFRTRALTQTVSTISPIVRLFFWLVNC